LQYSKAMVPFTLHPLVESSLAMMIGHSMSVRIAPFFRV